MGPPDGLMFGMKTYMMFVKWERGGVWGSLTVFVGVFLGKAP